MHNGHYYFNKMPKEAQENFKKAFSLVYLTFEEYLDKSFNNNRHFISGFCNWELSPQGYYYWSLIANNDYSDITYKVTPIKSEPLYTASDLVKFGNYLLSPERKVTHEDNRGVVTDADLEWINLNKE